MIGPIVKLQPLLALLRCQHAVPGYDGAIRQAHDQRRIIITAVRIDQQPRIVAENGWDAQHLAHLTGDLRHADIVSDMPLELALLQAERAIPQWKCVIGVITNKHQTCIRAAR